MNAARRTRLDRALSIVTRVEAGEGLGALLLALNVCLLLTAYYVIKPVREALILSGSGAEVKSYASVGQALLLALIIPAYGALAARLRRSVLIPVVNAGFMACLVGFYLAARAGVPHLGVAFYLWVGVFNLMVIAQFWSFANDLYTREQGERLFPIVAMGASVGAVLGSWATSRLVRPLGVEQLLLVSAAILGAGLFVTKMVEQVESRRARGKESPDPTSPPPEHGPLARAESFRLVLRSPYLRLVAVLILLLNLVNTTGEFILGSIVEDWAREAVATGKSKGLDVGDTIGEFYAGFFFLASIIGVAVQALLVSRVIRWIGVRGGLVVLPALSICAYLAVAVYPVLWLVRWMKTAENATDYSLYNTVKNALFLPLSREEKYQAKQVIDGFCVRSGDVLSAGLVFVGLNVLSLSVSGFAWVNVGLVGAWLLVAWAVGCRYHAGKTGR